MSNQITIMAERLNIDQNELHNIVLNTIMPQGKNVEPATQDQFLTFMAVANEYGLNPMTKEIYAYPKKGGGIQPIVSIDGWMKIINSHPQFDGMEFTDSLGMEGQLLSVTCRIYRKDREHPVEVTEYMNECAGPDKDKWGNPTPWGRWPARMLRHKAAIQAARYAFGFSGIVDPDEADRIESSDTKDMGAVEVVDSESVTELCSDEKFAESFPKWQEAVLAKNNDPAKLIAFLGMPGRDLHFTEEQTNKIMQIGVADNG